MLKKLLTNRAVQLLILISLSFSSLYGQYEDQLKETQKRVKERILDDVKKVSFDIAELALSSDYKDSLLKILDSVKVKANADTYPQELTGFRAILPFHENHAKVFSVYSSILNEKSYDSLEVWQISRFDHFDLFAVPFKRFNPSVFDPPLGKVSQIDLTMMRNERRSQAVNVTNCTPNAQTVKVILSNIPQNCDINVLYTVFVDTKRGLAEPSALLPANKNGSNWMFDIPSGLTRQVWFMVNSKDVVAGKYEILVKIESDVSSKEFPFKLTIAPIEFPNKPDYNLAMFDYAADMGRAITAENQKAAIEDLQDHLVTMYSVHSTKPRISSSDFDASGNLIGQPDISQWEETVKMLPDSQYITVFLALQWDKSGLGFIFADFPAGSEAGDNALKQWVQYFENACKTLGVNPERILLMTFDEPRSNENFIAVYKSLKIIKENSSFTTYVTTGVRGIDNEYCVKSLEYTDISQPNRRHFNELSIKNQQIFRDFAKKSGKQLWFYDAGYSYKDQGFSYYIRGGWQDILMGGTGSAYWSYCDAGDNPSNWNMYPEYRRVRDNYAPQYIDEISVTTSREWEGIRESVENGQYVLMLKELIAKKEEAGDDASTLKSILNNSVPRTPKQSCELRLKVLTALSNETTGISSKNLVELSSFFLSSNYPNPFNPSTTIEYRIPKAGDVDIKIFDINGQLVRTLKSGFESAGSNKIIWNSKNDFGEACASGIYMIQVAYNKMYLTRKAILLK